MTIIKMLFADIDGTLTETISGKPFKQNPQDVKLTNEVYKAIINFHSSGWIIIGVSNQGGCAAIDKATGKPYKLISEVIEEMHFNLRLIPELSSVYFCPDFEGNDCWRITREYAYEISDREMQLVGQFRKPNSGMLELAKLYIEDGNVEISKMMMVGDRQEDAGCAKNMGCDFMWAKEWREARRTEYSVRQTSRLLYGGEE